MSFSAMTVSSVNNPDKLIDFKYNSGLWKGSVSVADLEFKSSFDLINYLQNKYQRVYFFRVNMARTFRGTFVKPKDIYKNDMTCDAEPNLIMVSDGKSLKMVTTQARRAKEFVAFSSSAKNVYVPVFLYKDQDNKIQLINFK